MTEAGIILPWWLISLLAGVLMTTIVWQRQQLRRACWHALDVSSAILDRWRLRCAVAADSWQERADKAFSLFAGYLAATRYRLAMVDYMQLLTGRWQTVEALCKDSDALIERAYRELDAARMEKPEAPEWVAAADAIGGLPGGNSQPATVKILQAMLAAAESQHAEAMREFRWAAALRGRALLASVRYWRQLNVRLAAIENFGKALRAGEQTLAKTSARVGEFENQGHSGLLMRGLVGGLLTTVLLGMGIWFSLFLLAAQQSLVDGFIAGETLAPGWAAVWPSFYLIAIFALGATAACAARVSDMFSRVAELGAPWRARIGILCVLLLAMLSGGGMQMIVVEMRNTLLSSGWTELSAVVASGLLYALPLFLSIQLCVMVHWIRASKPLTCMMLEYTMRASEKGLAASCVLLAYLRNGISLDGIAVLSEEVAESGSGREPGASEPAAEGVTLVADISSKKAG